MDFEILETGQPLSSIADDIVSANAYIGAGGIVEALKQGSRHSDFRKSRRSGPSRWLRRYTNSAGPWTTTRSWEREP